MSADNWTQCPRCLKELRDKANAAECAASQMYGTAPLEEFDKARAVAEEVRNEAESTEACRTFREDWELGLVDGNEFYVYYQGGCSACTFAHKFRHEERLRVGPEVSPPAPESRP